MNKRHTRTTLTQVAETAGVSIATVDRVINRRGGVSPKKETAVLDAARTLGLDRILFRGYMKMLRIAVVMQSPENPFYLGLRDAFIEMNTSAQDLKLQCPAHYSAPTDTAATVKQLHKLAQEHDALVVDTPADPEITEAVRKISTEIPVVTMISDLPDSGRIAYVGPNNRQQGRVAGELMGRFIGEKGGDLCVILGMQRLVGHEEREMGFRAVLRERFPNCRIVGTFESEEDQSQAAKVIHQALTNKSEIKGIYNVSSGNSAIVKTIKSLRLSHNVTLITHELTVARQKMLREGVIDAVIDQNPRLEARRVVDILAKHFGRLENTELRVEDFTPFQIYLRENC